MKPEGTVRHRHRWLLRFSLRALLVAITVFGVWLGIQVNTARRQRDAVERIVSLGGSVFYDYQRILIGGEEGFDRKREYPAFAWARPLLEQVLPPDVVVVRLQGTAAGDDDLQVLTTLPRVFSLTLSDTEVTDRALFTVKELPDLRTLFLDGTAITDDGLAAVASCQNLHTLILNNTAITDDGLAAVANCQNLRCLSLLRTSVTDRGLSMLGQLPLEILDLSTHVTDAGARHLREIRTLRHLSLDDTRVTDAALADIAQLQNLEGLGLVRTQVTDAGVQHLTRLRQLSFLNLIGTSVSRNGLRSLRKAFPKADISPL